MAKRQSAKALVKAAFNGELTVYAALEEHLHENYRGELDVPDSFEVDLAICYANMGWLDRTLEDSSMSVAGFIKEFGLKPFLPLLDRQEKARFKKGDLVKYEGEVYRVIGRREVSPFAAFSTDDFEVFIEPLKEDGTAGFVPENEIFSMDEAEEDESDE